VDQQAFAEEWGRIVGASPVPLDPSKVGEVLVIAALAHPLRDQIIERTKAGEQVAIRLMEPDWEAVDRGDDVPIMVQLYLEQPFVSIATTSILSFAAEPDEGNDG
jgi:hypothetical protein